MAKATEVPEQYKDVVGAFPYTLKGRKMWFKPAIHAQFILLQREWLKMTQLKEGEQYGKLYIAVQVKTLAVIESQFLDEADREWVEDLMLNGKIDIPDLMPILSGGKGGKETDDDAEVEQAPRAQRRAAKKAMPVKKAAANAQRTRR